jgi:parallel beta-helix repeat protein
MNGKVIVVFGLLLFSIFLFHGNSGWVEVKALNAYPVHNVSTGLNYSSIQEAIDASETVNGNVILVDAGTYYTTLVVDKSLAIIGSGWDTTVIDGGRATLVLHVDANDVLFDGFTVKDGSFGIYLDHSNDCVFRNDSVTDVTGSSVAGWAIWVVYSENLTLDENIVGPNNCSGILVSNSYDFNVSGNYVHDNIGYGINANASYDGLIAGNNAFENSYDGIGLSRGCRNVTIARNSVSKNVFGVDIIDSDCVDNLVYDNDIIDNGKQASVVSANRWDNGVEGNYWSDYSGVDQDRDGVGDTPQALNANNTDNFPLMGSFSVFETSLGFDVDVVSNSSIVAFSYFLWNGTIVMDVGRKTVDQTFGFCRVRLPHGLMTVPYNVTVDGADPLYWNYTVYDDGGSRWIYFAYQQSDREVLIRGRSPPPTVSIIFPENETYTASDVPLAFTVDEETSWLAYSLDGQTNVTVTGNTTLPGVSNGTHTLVLYALNSFGDESASRIVYFTVSVAGSGLLPFLLAAAVTVVAILAVVFAYSRKLRRRRGRDG